MGQDTKAAVWIRVSTNHQEGDNQVPDPERFCTHHGLEVVKTFTVSDQPGTVGSMAASTSAR
jgi:DNA invertase Pin-like site-specific DNA recombinase